MSWSVLVAIAIVMVFGVGRSFLLKGRTNWCLYYRGAEGEIRPFLAVLSIFASLAGGFMIFGLIQMGFEGGATGYVLGVAYIIGMLLLAKSLDMARCKIDLSKGIFGLDAFIREVYGPVTQFCFLLLTAILFAGVLGGQFLAVGFYLQSFSGIPNYVVVLGIGCVGTVLYTVFFGFRGVLTNDIIQGGFVLAVSFIVPVYALLHVKQAGTIQLQPFASGLGGQYGWYFPTFAFIFLLPSFFGRVDIWQRARLVARNELWKVLLLSGIVLTWFFFSMTTVGVLIKDNQEAFAFTLNKDPGSYIAAIVEHLVKNPFFQIVCLSGILFALLSSIDSYLNIVSLAVVRVLLWHLFGGEPVSKDVQEDRDKTIKMNAQICTIAVALAALVLAVLIPNIVDLLSASFAAIGIVLPVFIFGLKARQKIRDYVGWIPIVSALFLLVILFPFLRKNSFIPAVLLSIVLFILLFLTQKPTYTINRNRTTQKNS